MAPHDLTSRPRTAPNGDDSAPAGPERPVVFSCLGEPLLGIVHEATAPARRGVIIVVGGPQYRVGSHRLYVSLARALAAGGIPAFRFDYRGIGDSSGRDPGFENTGPDIAAAIEAFTAEVPSVREIVLWGLCGAACAILSYAHTDPRVCAAILLNPWMRTEQGQARAYVFHYYARRIVERSFWAKLARGGIDPLAAVRSFAGIFGKAFIGGRTAAEAADAASASPRGDRSDRPLSSRMADGLGRYRGRCVFVLSGRDLTAREFADTAARSRRWRRLLAAPNVVTETLPDCDHTFSRAGCTDRVIRLTRHWVSS